MCGGESVRDLHGDIENLPDVVGWAHRLTVHVLHHDVVFADVVNLRDVRMVQCGNCAGLTLEAFGELSAGELDRDSAVESSVAGFPDLAMPS